MAWVPTVSGRLSFSIIGQTSWPQRCVRVSDLDGGERAVFFQERYCDDFTFPFLGRMNRVRNLVFGIFSFLFFRGWTTGRHFFVCHAQRIKSQGTELDYLRGTIYPILASRTGVIVKREILNDIVSLENAVRLKREIEQSAGIECLTESLEDRLRGVCPVLVDFSLIRDGLISLTPRSPREAPGGRFPNDKDTRDYVEQAFFFIRDISHEHQHHDPSTDTIIVIHEKNKEAAARIFFDLFRSVIRFKRVRNVDNIVNAAGVLSYASSFKSVAAAYKNEIGELPNDYQVENLCSSLSVARESINIQQGQRSNGTSLFLTIFFGFFSLILSFTLLSRFADKNDIAKVQPSPLIINTTKLIAGHPLESLAIIFIFVLAVGDMTGFTNISNRRWFEDWQRLMQFMPKWIFGPITVVVGLLFLIPLMLFV
ncbi:hypothetical protein [Rhodovulum iodosum]|uniref:hypothetical protein n=1 Tax=Rhodovulum iodosum TaxID=68291 RepID=UPI0011CF1603